MNSAIENNRHTYKIISEQLDKVNSIVRREYNLTTNGKALYAREIFPAVQSSGKYVIFVHGLTFPSSVDFDLPRKGYSVTEYLSSKGINCCIFDIRG